MKEYDFSFERELSLSNTIENIVFNNNIKTWNELLTYLNDIETDYYQGVTKYELISFIKNYKRLVKKFINKKTKRINI